MGVVMGHELTHAFDDQGREYDKQGNLHRWWQNSTLQHFEERIQCFMDQYSSFQINGDHVSITCKYHIKRVYILFLSHFAYRLTENKLWVKILQIMEE